MTMKRRFGTGSLLLFFFFLAILSCQKEQYTSSELSGIDLMPWPKKISRGSGELRCDGGFLTVWTGQQGTLLTKEGDRFNRQLGERFGIPLAAGAIPNAKSAVLEIGCRRADEDVQSVRENESYTLRVTPSKVTLKADTPLGVIRGMETLLQLIDSDEEGYFLPAVRIQDEPRFPWRGLLIDACRHWIPPGVIKRNLDGMAAVKLNVLHWHLSEDQGFRVECKSFPRLHQLGSDGNYYTQDQVRDIIEYARVRGIRVVPEFDMPGHTTSWFVGYPELASGPGPFHIERHWGVFDPCMDPTREEVYAFLDIFIGEMADLFPDEYFHIGGDEVNGRLWNANPDITSFKNKRGMKDNHDLQAYFNKRISAILQKHGKKMIGWDEIFHPDLPRDVVVQSWRGPESLAEIARRGYMGILSNGYYMDHILSAAQHYRVEPLGAYAADLSEEEKNRILGGEACMWAEFVTAETIDSRIWPRTAAIAERLWSPQSETNTESMYRRLEVLNRSLDFTGLRHNSNYAPMLERLAGGKPIDSLKVLADIVEPVRYYTRPATREYTQATPLVRLVDAARPESFQARKFCIMVDEYLEKAPGFEVQRETMEEWLQKWRKNEEGLKPLLEKSPLLNEIIPLSKDAASLAGAGIRALECIEEGREAPLSLVEQVLPLLNPPRRPGHELLIMVAPGIEKLVKKARPPLAVCDFEDGQTRGWEPNVPGNWRIGEKGGNNIYQLTAPGVQGEVRAPTSRSLLKDFDVSSFILTGRLSCASPDDNPHRDMVILFHYQDPTHFYYVHFSAVSDESHNIIGLVDGKDRVKINLEPAGKSEARLKDMRFHDFMVSCNGETGEIKAYLDDMITPVLTARDRTFGNGLVGVGSFDDTGSFDDIKLWGEIRR
jgi:hexosaminidase